MSIKRFCDRCGEELTKKNCSGRDSDGRLFGRISLPGGKSSMFVQVIVGTNETWNSGDYCNFCIAAALRAGLNSQEAEVIAPKHIVGAPQEA